MRKDKTPLQAHRQSKLQFPTRPPQSHLIPRLSRGASSPFPRFPLMHGRQDPLRAWKGAIRPWLTFFFSVHSAGPPSAFDKFSADDALSEYIPLDISLFDIVFVNSRVPRSDNETKKPGETMAASLKRSPRTASLHATPNVP
jgi:hypothetical protein